ncbi:MAG: hypothetical protein HZY76_02195 [Anaerolineae bacterium]|nr:MAG: hypothetical protein HZY76_02195 [Anaerolineae bacterium]
MRCCGLEEQGLIARQLDPNDRRSFTIHLTDLARTQIRENAPQHVAFLNQLCAGLSPDESSILLSLLAKLRQSLLQYTAVDDCHTVNSAPSVSVHAGSMRS